MRGAALVGADPTWTLAMDSFSLSRQRKEGGAILTVKAEFSRGLTQVELPRRGQELLAIGPRSRVQGFSTLVVPFDSHNDIYLWDVFRTCHSSP